MKRFILGTMLFAITFNQLFAWGALAVGKNKNGVRVHSWSSGYNTENGAKTRAIDQCRGRCNVVGTFHKKAAAYAVDSQGSGMYVFYTIRGSEVKAIMGAQANIIERRGTPDVVVSAIDR